MRTSRSPCSRRPQGSSGSGHGCRGNRETPPSRWHWQEVADRQALGVWGRKLVSLRRRAVSQHVQEMRVHSPLGSSPQPLPELSEAKEKVAPCVDFPPGGHSLPPASMRGCLGRGLAVGHRGSPGSGDAEGKAGGECGVRRLRRSTGRRRGAGRVAGTIWWRLVSTWGRQGAN